MKISSTRKAKMRATLAGIALIGLVACGGASVGTTGSGGGTSTGAATTGGSPSNRDGTTSGSTGTVPFVDQRDGQSYATVVIGSQTWFAQNMNYSASSGSLCYGNDAGQCDLDGRLYTFTAAVEVCPAGWNLPSDDDWKTLESILGMASDQLEISGETAARGTNQGAAIKEGGSSGFDAKLAGYATGSVFDLLGTDAYFWTSTTDSNGEIWRRHVDLSTPYLYRFENPPAAFAISVRCVR